MKIKCKICGKEKGASKDRYQKLLTKYGSEKELLENYICRDCRKDPKGLVIKAKDGEVYVPTADGVTAFITTERTVDEVIENVDKALDELTK